MKNWIEIGEHNRPEVITVNLLADEEAINIVKKTNKIDWEYLFADTEQYEAIVQDYRVQMNAIILPQYTDAVFSNIDPTNVQLETEITGKKYWVDDDSESRPDSIIVSLLANNQEVDKQVVTAQNNWQYKFTNVPEYDLNGERIIYTIVEEKVEGYETRYEGYDLINLRVDMTEASQISPPRIITKKDRMLAETEVSSIAVPIIGGVILMLGFLAGKSRKRKN